MDQVSRPLLVALLATLGLAVSWMTILRPQADSAGSPAPAAQAPKAPGAAGLGRAVDHAGSAAKQADRSAAAAQAAAGQKTAKAATPATPTAPAKATAPTAPVAPKARVGTGSAGVLRSLDRGHAVVLLFAGQGADDAVAREAARAAAGPRVDVVVASIDDLSDYGAVTRGVDVLSTPSLLVIGPDRKARTFIGLVEAGQIRAAAQAALQRKS